MMICCGDSWDEQPLSVRRSWQSEKRSVGAALLRLWRLRAAKRTGGGDELWGGEGPEAVPAVTHQCLALDLSTRAIKARGLLMTFTLRSRGLNALPQCSSLSHGTKTTSRLNSSFTHRLLQHRAAILWAQPSSEC